MSYTNPEAVKYFSSIAHRPDCDTRDECLQPKESKISRIATNQLQYKSLKSVCGFSSKVTFQKEKSITLKKHR